MSCGAVFSSLGSAGSHLQHGEHGEDDGGNGDRHQQDAARSPFRGDDQAGRTCPSGLSMSANGLLFELTRIAAHTPTVHGAQQDSGGARRHRIGGGATQEQPDRAEQPILHVRPSSMSMTRSEPRLITVTASCRMPLDCRDRRSSTTGSWSRTKLVRFPSLETTCS